MDKEEIENYKKMFMGSIIIKDPTRTIPYISSKYKPYKAENQRNYYNHQESNSDWLLTYLPTMIACGLI